MDLRRVTISILILLAIAALSLAKPSGRGGPPTKGGSGGKGGTNGSNGGKNGGKGNGKKGGGFSNRKNLVRNPFSGKPTLGQLGTTLRGMTPVQTSKSGSAVF